MLSCGKGVGMAKVTSAHTLYGIIFMCASKVFQSDQSCVLVQIHFYFVQTAIQPEIIDKIPLSPQTKQ